MISIFTVIVEVPVHTRRKPELAWMCSVGPKVVIWLTGLCSAGNGWGQLSVCMVAEAWSPDPRPAALPFPGSCCSRLQVDAAF